MKRGFTLVEMMIALSIGAIMLTAIGGMLTSVWMLAHESLDEVQCALRACSLRDKLFHKLTNEHGTPLGCGLMDATNIYCQAGREMIAYFKEANNVNGKTYWTFDLGDSYYCLDSDPTLKYLVADSKRECTKEGPVFQYVYLAIPGAKAVYYDRMIVPIDGRSLGTGEKDKEEFGKFFGYDTFLGGEEWEDLSL